MAKNHTLPIQELWKTFPVKNPGKRINTILRHPDYNARKAIDRIFVQSHFKKYLPFIKYLLTKPTVTISVEEFVYMYFLDWRRQKSGGGKILPDDTWNTFMFPWFTELTFPYQVSMLTNILREVRVQKHLLPGMPIDDKIARLVGEIHFPKYKKSYYNAKFVAKFFPRLGDINSDVWDAIMRDLLR